MNFLTKKNLINMLLLALSVIFSLLLVEQGFRCRVFGWKAFDIGALRYNVPINNSGIIQRSTIDDIYWLLKPNLDQSFKLAHLTTNSHGLADREYPLVKPANSYRIALLGDSYSMSSGVDTDKSYHALLEKRMNEQGDRPYEIINFAVGGFGLQSYNAVLEHLVPPWRPDAILLGYCGFNDHQELPPKTDRSPIESRRIDGFRISYILEYITMKREERKIMRNTSSTSLNENQLAFINQELRRVREMADQIKPGMPVILVYLDNRVHSESDLLHIAAIAENSGMQFIDTSRQFSGTRIDDYSLHILDSHPNERAQKMFSETLFSAILQKNLFDFTCATAQ